METMMSHLLASARANLSGQRHESPMDLSYHKAGDHQCERFVDQEDLRSESFLSQSSETDTSAEGNGNTIAHAQVESPPNWYPARTPGVSQGFCSSTSSAFRRISQTQTDVHISWDNEASTPAHSLVRNSVKTDPDLVLSRKPHPFSITAILGPDCASNNNNRHTDSAPAQVFSTISAMETQYVYSYHYHSSLGGIQQQQQQPRTSTPCRESAPAQFDPSAHAYWCHVCNEFCGGRLEANRHEQAHRSVGATCGLRRLIFRQHGYVTVHEQTGYLDRIKCGLCNKIIASCFFSKHQQLHNGHVCRVCDHEFSTNSRLKDHVTVHTGSTPFACELCNRKFAKRSSFTQHQRYHREYKSFQCQFCAKYFNSKYACVVHERLHTGDNPFKCEVPGCERAFPQKIQLRLHMNTHKKSVC